MCAYDRFKRERMIKMATRPYDKAYQQIIQFTACFPMCLTLFYLLRSLFDSGRHASLLHFVWSLHCPVCMAAMENAG